MDFSFSNTARGISSVKVIKHENSEWLDDLV